MAVPQNVPQRSNKALFWSLVVLGVVMVVAVAFSIRKFKRDMSDNVAKNAPGASEGSVSVPLSDVMTEAVLMGWNTDADGFTSVSGRVKEVTARPEVNGKWIKLVVSPVVDPKIYEAPDKVYQYLLSENDTKGDVKSVKIGDMITVSSRSKPSEVGYLLAGKVEKK